MPRGDYAPGAFTAQVGVASVQYKLKGMLHEQAIAELECIAYPCDRGAQCSCPECDTFRVHPEGLPEFHVIDHTVDICKWLELEEIQQDRREALRRIKTRQRLETEARTIFQERVQDDPTLQYVPPIVLANPERLEHRWVLVFNADTGREQTRAHMEEAWSMCVRMWEEGLYLSHRVSHDEKNLYITIAANVDVLKEEAERKQISMRLKETMGMLKYQKSIESYFVEMANHTRFNSAQEQVLVMHRMDTGWRIPLENRMSLPERLRVLERLKSKMERSITINAKFLCMLFTTFGAYRHHDDAFQYFCPQTHTAARLTEIDQYFTVYPATEEEFSIEDSFMKLGGDTMAVSGVEDVGALAVDAAAATAQASKKIALASAKESSKAAKVAIMKARGKKDRHMGKDEMTRRQKERYSKLNAKALEWDDLTTIILELEAWMAGGADRELAHQTRAKMEDTEYHIQANKYESEQMKVDRGRAERFTGLLVGYFPTHDYEEMEFYRRCWADLSLICKLRMRMRTNEGKYTEGAYYNPYAAVNTQMGEKERPFQCTLWYQPIDEIRDYFGDETALYFAWLGIYTKSLGMQSILGVLTMALGMVQNNGSIDPDLNDFTLLYSVSVAVWSVMFLQQWHRRENELKFLWGTEGLADNQTPRMEFKGKLDINMVTGRETIIEKGWVRGFARKAFSWTVILTMMTLTVASALLAESLNTKKAAWYAKFDLDDNKYLNVTEIQGLFDAFNSPDGKEENVGECEWGMVGECEWRISQAQQDALLANWFNGTMYPVQTPSLFADSSYPIGEYTTNEEGSKAALPVCDGIKGQCLGKSVCANWVADGDCRTTFNISIGIPTLAMCELTSDKDMSISTIPGHKYNILKSSEPTHREQCVPHAITGQIMVPAGGKCGCVNFAAVWKRTEWGRAQEKVGARSFSETLDENLWVAIGGLTNLVLLQSFGFIFEQMAVSLNDFENHRLQETHDNNLVVKNFLFEFVNNYFVMFYIAYLRHIEFPVGVPQKCDKSCLSELQIKLFIVFTGKTLAKKIPEYVIPLGKKYLNLKDADTSEAEQEQKRQEGKFKLTVEEQARMEEWEGMFMNFKQMVVQFGYLALFAPACSLAPLLAFLNNVTEIRSDAWSVCNLSQRPLWKSADSIGAWAAVLKVVAIVAVVINSTMVFFVGSQMSCPLDRDDVILWKNATEGGCLYGFFCDTRADGLKRPTFAERRFDGWLCNMGNAGWNAPSSNKAGCPVTDAKIMAKQGSTVIGIWDDQLLPSESMWYMGDPNELDGIDYRVTVSRLWIWAVAMEHVVLILRFALSAMAPTDPMWVETARETLNFRVDKMRHDEAHGLEDIDEKLQKRAGRKEAKAIFHKYDKDGDGSLDEKEVQKCINHLQSHLPRKDQMKMEDVRRIMLEMDTDKDGIVNFLEFNTWWSVHGGKNRYQLKDASQIFQELDKDGSGSLDKQELWALCSHLGMKKMTERDVTRLMNEINVDGDGDISIDEFVVWWEENGSGRYKPQAPPGPGDPSNTMKYHEKIEYGRMMANRQTDEDGNMVLVQTRMGCMIHVGGLEGDELEDETKLATLFEQFGAVTATTLRHRRVVENGKTKVSWALISFAEASAATAALAGSDSFGYPEMVTRSVKIGQAMASKGDMAKVAKVHNEKDLSQREVMSPRSTSHDPMSPNARDLRRMASTVGITAPNGHNGRSLAGDFDIEISGSQPGRLRGPAQHAAAKAAGTAGGFLGSVAGMVADAVGLDEDSAEAWEIGGNSAGRAAFGGGGGWGALHHHQRKTHDQNIAKRAARVLAAPLPKDTSKMTHHEHKAARYHAALDDRIDRLLMGEDMGEDKTEAPPAVAPRPSMLRQPPPRGRPSAGSVGAPGAGAGMMAPASGYPGAVSSIAAMTTTNPLNGGGYAGGSGGGGYSGGNAWPGAGGMSRGAQPAQQGRQYPVAMVSAASRAAPGVAPRPGGGLAAAAGSAQRRQPPAPPNYGERDV